MSVFRDGFTREAALAVADATWADLASLVEKSLLRMDSPERYGMHELLRQYAEEQLRDARDEALTAHCAYFTTFMADREADIKGKRQLPAMDEIAKDFENVRIAWIYACEQVDAEKLGAILETLYWFCVMRTHFSVCSDLLQMAWKALVLISIGCCGHV